MEADQPAGTVPPSYFRRRAIQTAPTCGWQRIASHDGEPIDRSPSATGFQHLDGSHLVGASKSAVVGRSAAPEKTGRLVGGSAAPRRGAHQPQSLRSSGFTDTAPAGVSRRLPVYCSGGRGPAASLEEHRARSRAGLGRIIGTSGLHYPLGPGAPFLKPEDFRPQHDPVVRVFDRMSGTARIFRGGHRVRPSFFGNSARIRIAAPGAIADWSVRAALVHVAAAYVS